MKRDSINYLAAGITVVAAFAVLLFVLYKITGRSGPTDQYHTFYDQVAGLGYGTPVYYEGYRVGQVEEVTPQHSGTQTTFRIDFTVEKDWPIPIDSIAQVATAGLLSDVFIVLEQGEAERVLVSGAEIKGREAADLFAALNSLAGDAKALTEEKIKPLIDSISDRIDTFTAPLGDGPTMGQRARNILSQVDEAAASLTALLGKDNRDSISATLDNMEQVSGSANDLADELRNTRAQLDSLLSELSGAVTDNRPELNQTVDDMQQAVEAMSLRLDSISFHLDEASRNMNEFSRTIRNNPSRVLFNSDAPEPD